MRVEAAAPSPEAPPGVRAADGFEAALRIALTRERTRGTPCLDAPGLEAPACAAPAGWREAVQPASTGPPRSEPAASATPVRVLAALEAQRLGARAGLEIASGDGVRWTVAEGPGGVEVRARAPPALERAARTDLQAISLALRERGVPLAKASVEAGPEPPRGAKARGR